MIDFIIHLVIYFTMYSLMTLSLNLQYGFAGMVNFGLMLFFGAGAYSSAIIVFHEWPLWMIPIMGICLTMFVALIVSLPVRRMKPGYWALVTFGAQEIFRLVMLNENIIAGGSSGTRGIPRITNSPVILMLILLAITLIAYLAVQRIRQSAFGRMQRVMREDLLLAASLGRDVYSFQLRTIILGAVMASVAGVAYAHYITYINPEAIMSVETFYIWTMLILGGTGNNLGALVGAATIQTISMSSRFVANYTGLPGDIVANLRIILIGLILVLILTFRPQGLIPERKTVFNATNQEGRKII